MAAHTHARRRKGNNQSNSSHLNSLHVPGPSILPLLLLLSLLFVPASFGTVCTAICSAVSGGLGSGLPASRLSLRMGAGVPLARLAGALLGD